MHMHQGIQQPCACTALRKASRAITRLYDTAILPAGMTTPQFAILRAIARENGKPLSRLAEEMVMDRSTLYRAIAPLVRQGWLTIENASSGRTKRALLTDAGHAAIEHAAPHWEAAHAKFIQAFGADRWNAVSKAIAELTDIGTALAP